MYSKQVRLNSIKPGHRGHRARFYLGVSEFKAVVDLVTHLTSHLYLQCFTPFNPRINHFHYALQLHAMLRNAIKPSNEQSLIAALTLRTDELNENLNKQTNNQSIATKYSLFH